MEAPVGPVVHFHIEIKVIQRKGVKIGFVEEESISIFPSGTARLTRMLGRESILGRGKSTCRDTGRAGAQGMRGNQESVRSGPVVGERPLGASDGSPHRF